MPVQADDKVLHVVTGPTTLPDTITKFEDESGIKVVYYVFDGNETLEPSCWPSKSRYDIVVPSNNFLAKQIKAGVYQKLDKSKLPNWKNLNTDLLKAVSVSDPGNEHAFPYMWGSIGIGFNAEKVKAALGADAPVDSWDLIFKPENAAKLKVVRYQPAGLANRDDSGGAALPGPANRQPEEEDIDKAEALILKVTSFDRLLPLVKYISDLANGNICVAVGYSGDIYQAKSRAAEAGGQGESRLQHSAGRCWQLLRHGRHPKDAENVEGAYKFTGLPAEAGNHG